MSDKEVWVDCWLGTMHGPDHLYPDCPHLARVKNWTGKADWPRKTLDQVDPDGGDICGWCVRVWHARHREAA